MTARTSPLLALWAWGMATCVAATPALRFHAEADTLWAEAWLSTGGGEGSLTVQLRNYTLQPIEMSYVGDAYVAQLRDGSTEMLEKTNFFHYPTLLGLGEQVVVRLHLPKTRPVREMTALVIRLQQGRRVLALNLDQPPAIMPDVPPAAPAVAPTEPIPAVTMPPPAATAPAPRQHAAPPAAQPLPETPAAPEPPPAPAAAPSAQPAPWLQLPAADVPVVVEFAQEFGGSLTLQVGWDQDGPMTKVYPEERKVFRVAPGPHVCRLRSEVQSVVPTAAEVPLVIAANEPLRLIVRGSVTLDGVSLHVEAWNNVTNDLLMERTFQPGT